jgi:hypothetical protein
MKVFLTFDVEIWCDGWIDIDRKFPRAFEQYVYGPTKSGSFGLEYQAQLLKAHGLTGVFFVEPLFAGRFGNAPLAEIVTILLDAEQDVQLHLHTEWIDEWPSPPLPCPEGKRQFLHQFSMVDQQLLIAEGMRRLQIAGAPPVACFRAGNFGFNADTLVALRANGIPFDSSYNATTFGLSSGVAPCTALTDVFVSDGVAEFPMTVYDTGFGRLRHAQLGACSWGELERLLWQALERGQQSFVLLSHNFELLSPSMLRQDPIVVGRFERLCRFLDRHRDDFDTCTFRGLAQPNARTQPPPLKSTAWHTAWRTGEQVFRRLYR